MSDKKYPALDALLRRGSIPHALLLTAPSQEILKNVAYPFVLELLESKKTIETHPDIHLLFPEGDLKLHPIEKVRALIRNVWLTPYESSKKAFIIHEPEKMLPAASHALLKTLEEPAGDSTLLLLSSRPMALLPTILSRCHRISLESPKKDKLSPPSYLISSLLYLDSRDKIPEIELEEAIAHLDIALLWYRDRHILEMGIEAPLHFSEHLESLKKSLPIPLTLVEKALSQTLLALHRSLNPSLALNYFFLKIRSSILKC